MLLQIKNLSFSYKRTKVFESFNLYLRRGEIVVLTGPNGSGKTTLLKIIAGILRPDSGELIVRARRISFVPYDLQVPPFFSATVGEVLSGLKGDELLNLLHVRELLKVKFSELSAGQRKRVLITLALVREPELLLLDEPFSALDEHNLKHLLKIFKYLREKRVTTLVVSHELRPLREFCDRVVKLSSPTPW